MTVLHDELTLAAKVKGASSSGVALAGFTPFSSKSLTTNTLPCCMVPQERGMGEPATAKVDHAVSCTHLCSQSQGSVAITSRFNCSIVEQELNNVSLSILHENTRKCAEPLTADGKNTLRYPQPCSQSQRCLAIRCEVIRSCILVKQHYGNVSMPTLRAPEKAWQSVIDSKHEPALWCTHLCS